MSPSEHERPSGRVLQKDLERLGPVDQAVEDAEGQKAGVGEESAGRVTEGHLAAVGGRAHGALVRCQKGLRFFRVPHMVAGGEDVHAGGKPPLSESAGDARGD